MALSSPGVEVKVIDESFYTPAEPGTVSLIVVASAENKQNGSGTGYASGTLKANAGELYLITSQKDLVDTFGDPVFKTDSNSNPIHAGEQNEYGLQAAYSLLGVSNRAFVVRADIDLNQLDASATPPTAKPANGTYWFDTQNTVFGVFEWNGNPATVRGGQTFTNKVPLVITDTTKIDPQTGGPNGSVGAIGDYAVVSKADWTAQQFQNELFYRNRAGDWVLVGGNNWAKSWPTVAGTVAAQSVPTGDYFYINGVQVTPGATLASLRDAINDANIDGGTVTAAVVNNKLELYHDGNFGAGDDSAQSNAIVITARTVTGNDTTTILTAIGIAAGSYYNPRLVISKHTQVPQFKKKNPFPRPTGSVWLKSTQANLGARWRVKRYNGETLLWENVEAPIYPNSQTAIYELDKVGGGFNLPIGALFVHSNFEEDFGTDESPKVANFRIMRRTAIGATTIRSEKITESTFTVGDRSFTISESLIGTPVLGDYTETQTFQSVTINFNITVPSTDDAVKVANAINSSGLINVSAEVDTQNRIVIKHKTGGEFRLKEGTGTPLVDIGLSAYNPVTRTGTTNLRAAPLGDVLHDFVASLWAPLVYTASEDPPYELTEDGKLWYSSVVDEIDILIHDGDKWVGYHSPTSPYYDADPIKKTDPMGPLVSATAPETQSDGTDLVTGDLWISTDDVENFPVIYKYNADIYSTEFKVGLMHNWAYQTNHGTRIEFKNMLNQIGVDKTANTHGWNNYRQGNFKYFSNQYSARTTYSGQLSGNHKLQDNEDKKQRRHLQEKEQALATLKKVAERTHFAQQVAEHKRAQKQTDEMAMSMLAYQRRENEQELLI